ncbi:MAG TPA: glycosyltransferase family 39 protein [Steroidobacteraceae bacterium]
MIKPASPSLRPLSYLCAAAVLVGVYARFKGLGSAPLAVDEYYLSRSIENVLRTGLPHFNCGGYYMRGLLLQYLAAAEQAAGMSRELAPRLPSALCSLATLPAVFLLGRRLQGSVVAILAVALLALSIWEIEIARFGRMYAPFQAVFVWYVVFFVRYTVDRNRRAYWPMLGLSIVGPLVWEGGVFLLLTNLLPVFLHSRAGVIQRKHWPQLTVAIALLAVGYLFVTHDFRQLLSSAWPADFNPSLVDYSTDVVAGLPLPMRLLTQHPAWLAAALIPAIAVLGSLPSIWSTRSRPLLTVGLVAILVAAAAHQFLAVIALGALLLLMGYVSPDELLGRTGRRFQLAIVACALFWLAVGLASPGWHAARLGGTARAIAMLGYQFLRVPDFIGVVVRPWGRAVPHLGLVLLLLCGAAFVRMALRDASSSGEATADTPLDVERVLLVVLLVLLLAASAANPPRQETRYVFNLYPLAILIALTTLTRIAQAFTRRPAAVATATAVVAFAGFALTEDFRPSFLRHIDSPEATFKADLNEDVQSHLIVRDDYRTLSQWLQVHAGAGTMVINGVHGLDDYYPGIRYFYVDLRDPNFADWACQRGTVERWGNYPLLDSEAALATAIRSAPRAYLVAFGYDNEKLLATLAPLHPRIAISQGHIVVVELRGS